MDLYQMDIHLLESIISDPDKKAEFLKVLPSHIEYIGDGDGDKIRVFRVKDLTIGVIFLNPPPQMEAAGVRIRDVTQMNLRDDDIIVATFPKTGDRVKEITGSKCIQTRCLGGTHWVCNLLKAMLSPGPLEDQISYEPPLVDFFPPEVFEHMPSPRILPMHMPPSLVPRDVNNGKGRVILMHRNPKDVAVSYYYHTVRMQAGDYSTGISWNCFVDAFMKGRLPPGDFFNYYNGWQKQMENHSELKVLFVCYEDLQRDTASQLQRILDFLGLSSSNENLQKVVDICSLDKLRSDVTKGNVPSFNIDKKNGESVIYRKGVVGDWRNHFSVAQNETMDAIIREKFEKSMFKLQI